jgi:hypothetical protein
LLQDFQEYKMKVQLEEDPSYFVIQVGKSEMFTVGLGKERSGTMRGLDQVVEDLLTKIEDLKGRLDFAEGQRALLEKRTWTARDALAGGLDDGSDPREE